jgi:hypothetical protein
MIQLSYPEHPFRLKTEGGKEYILDELRRKWVALQPEEWVRQHFLQYLLQVKNYPASLVAVERLIKLGDMRKRFDIAVFDRNGATLMLVECKAMDVALDEAVARQLLGYNLSLPAQYLLATNGIYCIGFAKRDGVMAPLEEVPGYV